MFISFFKLKMNKVFDTIIQSCEELGTLQQDGTVFLSPEQIRQCKEINTDLSLQKIEEEYRTRTFTTKREEYIKEKMNTYELMKKRIDELQKLYISHIETLGKREIDEANYNMEKAKFIVEKDRILTDINKQNKLITEDVATNFYNVEQVQYKDLVNRMFNLKSINDEKNEFQLNLDTTDQQLQILLDKRRKTQNIYKIVLSFFILLTILFVAYFVYYLFSTNTL
jgi:hypothetical protein